MKKKTEFTVKHIIAETSKEEKELHMRQAFAAMLKMANKDSIQNEKRSEV